LSSYSTRRRPQDDTTQVSEDRAEPAGAQGVGAVAAAHSQPASPAGAAPVSVSASDPATSSDVLLPGCGYCGVCKGCMRELGQLGCESWLHAGAAWIALREAELRREDPNHPKLKVERSALVVERADRPWFADRPRSELEKLMQEAPGARRPSRRRANCSVGTFYHPPKSERPRQRALTGLACSELSVHLIVERLGKESGLPIERLRATATTRAYDDLREELSLLVCALPAQANGAVAEALGVSLRTVERWRSQKVNTPVAPQLLKVRRARLIRERMLAASRRLSSSTANGHSLNVRSLRHPLPIRGEGPHGRNLTMEAAAALIDDVATVQRRAQELVAVTVPLIERLAEVFEGEFARQAPEAIAALERLANRSIAQTSSAPEPPVRINRPS